MTDGEWIIDEFRGDVVIRSFLDFSRNSRDCILNDHRFGKIMEIHNEKFKGKWPFTYNEIQTNNIKNSSNGTYKYVRWNAVGFRYEDIKRKYLWWTVMFGRKFL